MSSMFSRQADELILTMMEMRAKGVGLSEIARQLGVGKGKVIGAMRRIDEAEADQ
jgi:hypothetical protein